MRKWLLVVLALMALGFAALFALPRLISSCEYESPVPVFWIPALFLLVWAVAGLFVMTKGNAAQRFHLFAGMILILFGYGHALSMILPMVLRTSCLPMP